MTRYYDTGVLLKLYTNEAASDVVRKFVIRAKEPLCFTSLHLAECVSALRLKCFRKECEETEAAAAILDIESDLAAGVLRRAGLDWEAVWSECRALSDAHASQTGCRTLDALHVACARQLQLREFVTSDARQTLLAQSAGLRVKGIPGL